MSKITIGGNVYNYPDQGRDSDWGENASQAFYDLVAIVSSLTGNGYISESTVTLENNIIVLTDVPSLLFSSTLTLTAGIKYLLVVQDGTNTLTEEGTLILRYDADTAVPANSTWKMTREYTGDDSRVTFDVTSNGQVQYKTSNYALPATITMKFKTANLFQS
jgi:hypothetical protein